jgi:hypothetical protein
VTAPVASVLGRNPGQVPMNEQDKLQTVADTAERLGIHDDCRRQVLGELWDAAFEQGKIAALDELQDRFCVCMK